MEQIIYIIGQILGIVAIAMGFISYQTRTQKGLLLMQFATCAVFCLHYLMIGAFTATAMNSIGVVRNAVYYFREKKGSTNKLLPIIFAVIMAIVGIITWEAWYSVFVFAGLIINTLCLAFRDPQNVRRSILVSSPLVIAYDVFVLSIGGVVYESVVIVSSIIGIVRHSESRLQKEEKAKIKSTVTE